MWTTTAFTTSIFTTANIFVFCCLATIEVLATLLASFLEIIYGNGIPKLANNSRASSSVLAVVTITISIPLTFVTLS